MSGVLGELTGFTDLSYDEALAFVREDGQEIYTTPDDFAEALGFPDPEKLAAETLPVTPFAAFVAGVNYARALKQGRRIEREDRRGIDLEADNALTSR